MHVSTFGFQDSEEQEEEKVIHIFKSMQTNLICFHIHLLPFLFVSVDRIDLKCIVRCSELDQKGQNECVKEKRDRQRDLFQRNTGVDSE